MKYQLLHETNSNVNRSLPLQKRIRAHVWFKGNFVFLLHGAAILSTAYDKQGDYNDEFLALSNSAGGWFWWCESICWMINLYVQNYMENQAWRFIEGREWVFEKCHNEFFRSNINLPVAPSLIQQEGSPLSLCNLNLVFMSS